MKNIEDVGATAFDLPNDNNPKPIAPMYYGNQHVPKPCNVAAQKVDAVKVMDHVLYGK